ncbi:hypothetical protein [Motiliproteus sp. MSK22-1]|uniref:hypothetical protein n=1 Tax=Motiliproteus sp. MSK22-1 TaxID=1897630 RepID=UPI00117DFD52|nr:hypothetical protein [Motiliproteus sp. MSK22-1]
MRLVVCKSPLLIMVMIAAMLFPILMVEGVVVLENQPLHQHRAGDSLLASDDFHHLVHADVLESTEDRSTNVEDCHHVTSLGDCTTHCSTSSCVSLLMGFGTGLVAKPKTVPITLRASRIPDPLPNSILRPPLAAV